jgi:hypothetical protein
MKQILFAAVLALSFSALAKDYQVTGSVVEVTDTKIVVDKKGEKFEIAKSAATKAPATAVKVGDKVTVYYSMSASEIEAKPETAKKKK